MERVKYSQDELISKGEFIGWGGPLPIYSTPVTPRENFKAVFHGEKPHWIPNNADYCTIIPRVVPDNVARGFVMDAVPLRREEFGGKDMFGIEWEYVDIAGGSTVKPGHPYLTDISEWKEKLRFPDIDAWDWAGSAASNAEYLNNDRVHYIWQFTGLFERLISFLDFENAAMALIDEEQQDDVHALLSALCDLYERMIDKYKEYYDIDAIFFHDDWGSQRAPFFSVDTCREMLVPHLKRLVDYCHAKDIFFEFHSCGKNDMLAPCMIEAGVDTWAGQPMNDFTMLYEQYGDMLHLGLESGMPMEGSDEEILAACRAFVERYAPHMDTKPVFCADIFLDAKKRRYLYELSRQILD